MHLQILLGAAISLFHLALGAPDDNVNIARITEDYVNIERITNDFNIYADDKNFAAIGALFIRNGTYDPGNGPVQGIPKIEATLSGILTAGTVTQFALTTQRIVLLEPYDALGAKTATTLTYVTVTFFGQGKLKGKFASIPARYTDKLVKTSAQPYGGWEFSSRVFRLQVSFFSNPFGSHVVGSGRVEKWGEARLIILIFS